MIRAPLWFIGLLVVIAIGVGVYAYYTTPLPFGLGSVFRTPVSSGPAPVASGGAGQPVNGRAPAGQALQLGAVTVLVSGVARNQDLSTEGRGGPTGVFTVVDVQVQNTGSTPLTATASAFKLVDDQGRTYDVDPEATRSENAFGHRRNVLEASVPPGGATSTFLVFQTPPSANPTALRVQLGYAEAALQ